MKMGDIMMNRKWLLGLIVSLLAHGCAGFFDAQESVQVIELPALQSDEERRQNLAAIRALLSEQRQRAPRAPDLNATRSSEPAAPSWPPDWLSSYFLPARSSGEEADLTSVSVSPPSSSPSKPRAPLPDVTVKIPRMAEPPSRVSEAEPWPRVPAYTSPAPMGPGNPGSVRCAPDLLGGQRCHAE